MPVTTCDRHGQPVAVGDQAPVPAALEELARSCDLESLPPPPDEDEDERFYSELDWDDIAEAFIGALLAGLVLLVIAGGKNCLAPGDGKSPEKYFRLLYHRLAAAKPGK